MSHSPETIALIWSLSPPCGRAGEVGEQPRAPGLGRLGAVVGDHRGHHREVVGARGRAGTDHALVGRVGERLVGLRRVRHPVLGVEDHPGALRHAVPVAVGVTQVLGDPLVQHLGMHRAEQTVLVGQPDSPGVHRQEDVGGAVRAFGLHPGDQLLGGALDAVHLDTGLGGEVAVEMLVGVVVPRGVDVDLVGEGRGGGERGDERGQRNTGGFHADPPFPTECVRHSCGLRAGVSTPNSRGPAGGHGIVSSRARRTGRAWCCRPSRPSRGR